MSREAFSGSARGAGTGADAAGLAALPAATGGFRRGDLLFWRGHVALVVDETRLIHANGHSMSVAYEGITECRARIETTEGHGLRHHARL